MVAETAAAEMRTEHPHIVRRPGTLGGQPVIEGTRIGVRHIAALHNMGEAVDGILAAYPDITAAQVHDAISYYLDHKAEIDDLIERNGLRYVMREQGLVYVIGRGLLDKGRFDTIPDAERGVWYTHETLPADWD
jgi:uncharacterized protein (DUF433 family)